VSRQSVDEHQASLFDTPAAPEVRHRMDPHVFVPAAARDTQVIVAAAALPKTGTQRAKVLEAIRQAGPAGKTDQEIATLLGLAENSVWPRRLELADDGLIVDSGDRRGTSTGNPAIVWRPTFYEPLTIHTTSQIARRPERPRPGATPG
jgi:hypothetical protein